MNNESRWRPYIAGALVGVLAIASVWATTKYSGKGQYLGASTTFVRAAGLAEEKVAPEHVAGNAYYTKEKVKVDWQMMLVIGVALGAGAAALVRKDFKAEMVPPIWKERFGSSMALRALFAFLGGAVAMFGARLAGGCPSGHGLSGIMQLSVSGLIAMAGFFGAGVIVANLLYRKSGKGGA
ncbi:MAG: YeeE/YedE family protein [Planctomycetes bacterium]|nr:YeeE/YedE family protein [Planctomycetota bacterium]